MIHLLLASVLEPCYWVLSQHRSCLVLWLMGWPLPCTVSSRLLKHDSTVSCLALRLRLTSFMHRFHACSGHETAPYHASFSGRWVGSCLAPSHACSKVLRQHRFMPISQAQDWPLSCSVFMPVPKSWDSTVSCLALRLRIDPFHAPFSCLLRPWGSTVSCLLLRPMGLILPCTVSCLFQSLETAPFHA